MKTRVSNESAGERVVYMPTENTSVALLDSCYERFKEDVLSFREKGKLVLLADFNARVW